MRWSIAVVTVMLALLTHIAYAESLLEAPDKPLEDQWIISIGGWSKHVLGLSSDVTNETHNILSVEHSGYSVGYFKNSYGNDTGFAVKAWRKPLSDNWEVSASFGITYGYTKCYGEDESGKNICPYGWIGVSYTKYRVVPSVKILPGVIVFSPEIRF